MLKKFGIILSLISLGVAATIPSTYANTPTICVHTASEVIGDYTALGLKAYNQSPIIRQYDGMGAVLAKLLKIEWIADSDQVFFLIEPSAEYHYLLVAKDSCMVTVFKINAEASTTLQDFLGNSRMVNAP